MTLFFLGTGPDGVTRGAFSYLDDKGTQRTIQYIAGAGIGYRIVQDTTGPGTHLLPRPAVVEFGILYPRQPTNGDTNGETPGTDFDVDRNIDIPNDGSDNRSGTNGVSGFDGPGSIDDNSIDSDRTFGDSGNPDDFDERSRKGNRPGSERNDTDFSKRNRGPGTIITNSGDTFFGIAPGASARAHVQNIDIKPFGEDGAISPSEALRRDERRSHRSHFRG